MFETTTSTQTRQDSGASTNMQSNAPGKTASTGKLVQKKASTTPSGSEKSAPPKTPKEQFTAFVGMKADERKTFLGGLDATKRKKLADGLSHGDISGAPEQAAIRQLFDSTPATELATLSRWVAVRFNIKVGASSGGGKAWTKNGLRRSWDLLKTLPTSHVEANAELSSLTRYDSASIEGWASSTGEAAIGYGDATDIDKTKETGAFTDAGDPLRNTNLFDVTVLHEIGHRVDPLVNATGGYCTTADGGSWKKLDAGKVAGLMVTASGSEISKWSDAKQKKDIMSALTAYVNAGAAANLDVRFNAMSFMSSLSAAEKKKIIDKLRKDPMVVALEQGVSGAWAKPNGGTDLNGTIYQQSYRGDWTSYATAARARKMSTYQFRAPEEWFAEAYSAYYAPGTKKGELLGKKDAKTKQWFDKTVDPFKPPAKASGSKP